MAMPMARAEGIPVPAVSMAGRVALVLLAIALLWLEIYPTPFINLIRTTTGPLLASILQIRGL